VTQRSPWAASQVCEHRRRLRLAHRLMDGSLTIEDATRTGPHQALSASEASPQTFLIQTTDTIRTMLAKLAHLERRTVEDDIAARRVDADIGLTMGVGA
jgi:hypothetical protein